MSQSSENGVIKRKTCLKCSQLSSLFVYNITQTYCKSCFLTMVTHKFASTIGKERVYKDNESRETLIVFEGDPCSVFLASLIKKGMEAQAKKRLPIIPTVVVIVMLNEEENIDSALTKILEFKDSLLPARWLFCHLAWLCESAESESFDESVFCYGKNSIRKWEMILENLTESNKAEFMRICRYKILLRVAKLLNIDKIMESDCVDFLAASTLDSFAFGRGSMSCHGAVDKTFLPIKVYRPLCDISLKEVVLYNWLNGKENRVDLGKTYHNSDSNVNCVQKLTMNFFNRLSFESYRGSVMSTCNTASRIPITRRAGNVCSFCLQKCSLRDSSNYCVPCNELFKEVLNKDLLAEFLISSKFSI